MQIGKWIIYKLEKKNSLKSQHDDLTNLVTAMVDCVGYYAKKDAKKFRDLLISKIDEYFPELSTK